MLEKIFENGKITKRTDTEKNYKVRKMTEKSRCRRKFSQLEKYYKKLGMGENILNRSNVKKKMVSEKNYKVGKLI